MGQMRHADADFSSFAQLFCPWRFEVRLVLFCVHSVGDLMDVPVSLEAAYLNAPIPPFSKMVLEPKQKLCTVFIVIIIKMYASLNEICTTADIKELWNIDVKMTEVGLVP